MRQWTKHLHLWLISATILTLLFLTPTTAAFGQGNSDFGQSHKPSDPGNSDFGQSHKPSDPGNSDFGQSHKPSDPGNGDFGQSYSIPTPEPATLTLLALGGGAAAFGARFRRGRRK